MFSGKELAPVEDQGVVFLLVTLGAGRDARLYRRSYGQGLRDRQGAARVQAMFEVVFPSNGFGGYLLKNWHDRERTSHEIQPEVFGALSQIRELKLFAALPPALPGAGNYDVELVIKGTGTAEEVAGYAGQLVGAAFAAASSCSPIPISKSTCRRSGSRSIASGWPISGSISPRSAGSWDPARRRLRQSLHHGWAHLQGDPAGRARAREVACSFSTTRFQTRDGTQVPFSAVARLETSAAPRTLARFQRATVFASMAGSCPA